MLSRVEEFKVRWRELGVIVQGRRGADFVDELLAIAECLEGEIDLRRGDQIDLGTRVGVLRMEVSKLKRLLEEACEVASDAISQEGSGWPEGELSYFNQKNGWTERLVKILEAMK